MNKIRFRQALYDVDGKFVEWHYWGFWDQGLFLTFFAPARDPETAQENSYQFIDDLQDNDGNDIYENDIVELHNPNETHTSYKSPVFFGSLGATVLYHPAHVKAMGYKDRGRLLKDYIRSGGNFLCRVIGNIVENPELLNDNQDVKNEG